MKISEITGLKLDDYYWRLVFGPSRHRTNFFELRSTGFKGLPSPVFFLSTGRCGTNWFTMLLAGDKSVKAFHEPKPNFGVQGRVAYELFSDKDFQVSPNEAQLLQEIFLTGREQHLRYSHKTQRRFVETNNQVTFLAPVIYQLFPEAKFVHLNRHPGEFVRSALRRKFYNNTDDIKRIVPRANDPHFKSWEAFSALEKNSWLWMATNRFIERFKTSIPTDNCYYFNFNTLDTDSLLKLCTFLEISIPENSIRKMLSRRVNVQKTGDMGGYDDWTPADKDRLKNICGEMAVTYNYQL
jgi:hypothetical protein